jgi:hypothetical protein
LPEKKKKKTTEKDIGNIRSRGMKDKEKKT